MTEMSDSRFEELPEDFPDYDLEENEALSLDSLTDLVLYSLDWSVSSLLERIGTSFDINPMFQRRDAWTVERKSLYIESLVLGLPVPQIVLAEDKHRKGRFIVLDGKQRLITLKQFASPNEDFVGFKLKRLDFVPELEGMDLSDMSSSITAQDHAENFLAQPVRTIVVRNWTDEAVLYQVFVRLNQGSVSLSPQELRQALFPSEFTRWINSRSASSALIQRARRIKKADFRMRDAEMLLRYVAFGQSLEHYRGNLRAFLDDACKVNGAAWAQLGQDHFESLASNCEAAIQRTFDVFEESNSFLRFENGSYNRRFNIAVFDLMTSVLGDPDLSDEEVVEHGAEIRAAFEELCESDRYFAEALQTTTKTIGSTALRLTQFASAVEEIIHHPLTISARAASLVA